MIASRPDGITAAVLAEAGASRLPVPPIGGKAEGPRPRPEVMPRRQAAEDPTT